MPKTLTPTGPVSSKWFAAGYREAMTDLAQQYREGGEAAVLAWIAANGGTPVDLTLSRQYATPEELVALAIDNPEMHDDDTDECQLCGGHLLIDPCMPGITVHESTGTAECGPVTGHVLTDEALAAHSAPVEILGTECSTQDTVAEVLIPGDVVLGPTGWVIVAEVLTVSALDSVRINPTVRPLRPFTRHYQATVTVQPDADTASSASCQHFIETGRYLRRVAQDVCDGCGQPIEPDNENGHVHADSGLAGCGRPFSDTESYARPAHA